MNKKELSGNHVSRLRENFQNFWRALSICAEVEFSEKPQVLVKPNSYDLLDTSYWLNERTFVIDGAFGVVFKLCGNSDGCCVIATLFNHNNKESFVSEPNSGVVFARQMKKLNREINTLINYASDPSWKKSKQELYDSIFELIKAKLMPGKGRCFNEIEVEFSKSMESYVSEMKNVLSIHDQHSVLRKDLIDKVHSSEKWQQIDKIKAQINLLKTELNQLADEIDVDISLMDEKKVIDKTVEDCVAAEKNTRHLLDDICKKALADSKNDLVQRLALQVLYNKVKKDNPSVFDKLKIQQILFMRPLNKIPFSTAIKA